MTETESYQVRILDPAAHELARLDRQVGQRIVKRIYWLAENLDDIQPVALKGDLAGFYRLRVGDYRVVYEILHGERAIVIHLIGHRREVYR
jgi:mRNA interferase RelE/StbE